MLQRKITARIEAFYRNHPQKALMIVGARQVGKSYIIEDFARKHYNSVIKVDLIENPDYVSLFSNAKSAEDVLLRLSALFGDRMIPGETMIFFDEVQRTDHADQVSCAGRYLRLYSQRLIARHGIQGYYFSAGRLSGYCGDVPAGF